MEILNYEKQIGMGACVATFDFTIPALGFTCRRWKVMRGKNGGLYITSPSYSVQNASGEKVWHKYVEVSEKRSKDFQRAIMELLKPWLSSDEIESWIKS